MLYSISIGDKYSISAGRRLILRLFKGFLEGYTAKKYYKRSLTSYRVAYKPIRQAFFVEPRKKSGAPVCEAPRILYYER